MPAVNSAITCLLTGLALIASPSWKQTADIDSQANCSEPEVVPCVCDTSEVGVFPLAYASAVDSLPLAGAVGTGALALYLASHGRGRARGAPIGGHARIGGSTSERASSRHARLGRIY